MNVARLVQVLEACLSTSNSRTSAVISIATIRVGRETDYGRVARDFEAMADNAILLAVQQAAANPQAMTEAITAEQNDAASIAPSASTTITDTPAR